MARGTEEKPRVWNRRGEEERMGFDGGERRRGEERHLGLGWIR